MALPHGQGKDGPKNSSGMRLKIALYYYTSQIPPRQDQNRKAKGMFWYFFLYNPAYFPYNDSILREKDERLCCNLKN